MYFLIAGAFLAVATFAAAEAPLAGPYPGALSLTASAPYPAAEPLAVSAPYPAAAPLAVSAPYPAAAPLAISAPYPAAVPLASAPYPAPFPLAAPVVPAEVYGPPEVVLPPPQIVTNYGYNVYTPQRVEVIAPVVEGPYPAPTPLVAAPVAPVLSAPVAPVVSGYEYGLPQVIPQVVAPYPAAAPVLREVAPVQPHAVYGAPL